MNHHYSVMNHETDRTTDMTLCKATNNKPDQTLGPTTTTKFHWPAVELVYSTPNLLAGPTLRL